METNKLLFYRFIDYFIKLQKKTKSFVKKIYNISRKQILIIKEYIDEIFNKKYIRSNIFFYAVPVFIVKKSDNRLRIYIDYRAFNTLTIKNRNILLLIREILTKLYIIKIYSKFDIIVIFNKIRIKESDEKKIIFLIKYNFFEYMIIFFGLYNASNTFQIFINEILKEYLDNFCFIYLNDILIYNNIKKKYIEHVNKILKKLK